MKKQERIYFLLLFFTICLLHVSCSKTESVFGQWTCNDRDIYLMENTFEIVFHNSSKIKGFKGTLYKKGNMLELLFTQFKDDKNIWYLVKGTDLENYKEIIRYRIVNKELETYINNTGKIYLYSRMTF